MYKKANGDANVFLVLYVDDILLIGSDIQTMQDTKAFMVGEMLRIAITEFGYIKSEDLVCTRRQMGMVLYVDDILLIGSDIQTMQDTKAWLGKCFAMKDLGDAAYIIGHQDLSRSYQEDSWPKSKHLHRQSVEKIQHA